jgi:HK97 gp10 family phage protein
MDIKIELAGLQGVEEALAQAGPKLAKRAVRKALKAGGEIFVEAAKQRAPVAQRGTPQRRPGELRDSITMTTKLSPREESGTVHVGAEYKKSEGEQSPGVYGRFVEFGSVHNQPHPFLRPAFDASVQEAQDAMTNVLRDEVGQIGK